jgi:predicted acetyltransferase
MLSRTTAWWENERLHDAPGEGGGTSSLRVVVHESDGGADGYALYRQKAMWGEGLGNGEIQVAEVVASTPKAHTGLWRFLTSIDLFPRLRYRHLPVDDPLRWKVTEPGRLIRKREEGLWVRVLDVVAALNARSYAADGTIRMGIADAFRPKTADTYELTVSDGHGTCRRSDGAADVSLEIDMLGSLYLGSGHALSAARAGRIAGSEEAVVRLGRMFRGDIDPWCPEIF